MQSKLYKILLILGIIATMVAIILFWVIYNAPKYLEVNFLDVGQGDSILIQTPYDQNILIDGGPDSKVIEGLSKNLAWYDRQIDLMILTHPHDDHVTGLIDVLKRYNVKKILYTGVVHDTLNYIEWLELIRDKKISMTIIDRPQMINLGDPFDEAQGRDCDLEVLSPRESVLGQDVSNLNNTSIVSMLDCGGKRFLFMGDAEREVEEEIKNIKADVLKVGHHGSDTSSSEEFLELVSPEIAVIQVGEDNYFGHPSRRIIKRLERVGAEIFRNYEVGVISIRVLDGELVVE